MAKHQHQRAATLSVTLPLDLAQAVYQQVRDGTYGSAGQLIREAVRRLLQDDAAKPAADTVVAEEPRRRSGRRATEQP